MHRSTENIDRQSFDILICGGGIYGAWTAYDAAQRGLKVIIVDKQDWAAGTSSWSTKLIHGGLRYLQTLQINVVKKSLSERALLMRIAPHRVKPLRFCLPNYATNWFKRLILKIGLSAYDLLAGSHELLLKHQQMSREDLLSKFKILKKHHLDGGFEYHDAQTDDARFVLEVIAAAQQAGAICINYCEVISLQHNKQGKVCGAKLQDNVSTQQWQVICKHVINTAGHWLNQLADVDETPCRLSKGAHLVMPDPGLPGALLLEAKSDGRVFFLVPWYGRVLLGTTDDTYHGNLDAITVNQEDIDYLLNAANDYFETLVWTKEDILGSYAGLRVLKHSEASSSYRISREWIFKELENGLIVSIGGKLTSARQDAIALIDLVCQKLNQSAATETHRNPLPWTPNEPFENWHENHLAHASAIGLAKDVAETLIFRHGAHAEDIMTWVELEPELQQRIIPDLPFIYGDLLWCSKHEMVVHLEDLLRRRMPLLILQPMSKALIEKIAFRVGDNLGWSQETIMAEINQVLESWLIDLEKNESL